MSLMSSSRLSTLKSKDKKAYRVYFGVFRRRTTSFVKENSSPVRLGAGDGILDLLLVIQCDQKV
jgi:hypothetical protein